MMGDKMCHTCLLFFLSLAQHDDALDLVLPHHPPEINNSVWEGTLSGNIRTLASVTLSDERIVFGKGLREHKNHIYLHQRSWH